MTTIEQPMASQAIRAPAVSVKRSLRLMEIWTWICALAALGGWGLSYFRLLNRAGYICFSAAALAVFLLLNRGRKFSRPNWRKLVRRFRRPLPGMFAFLAFLVFAGSVFYAPTNYTGLTYHLARVLQWLAHGQWVWIHTPVGRMNYSGCDFEWLTTPLVLFTRSDRALFLVNFIAFLLLPGLVFSVFTRLGVNARVAWNWMWLLPAGYNFLLQSGSIDNDAFGAVFALAALDFACRAWASRQARDLWLSMLAIALLTGTKPVSLPLLLPWAILVFPLLPLLRRRWIASGLVAALAGIASFLTLALMNQIHSGDWLGRTAEPVHMEVHQPLIGILGNSFQFVLGNFLPPVFPWAGWWNSHAFLVLPHAMVAALNANFHLGYLNVAEIPVEDISGIGFGICWLLVVSLVASFLARRQRPVASASPAIPLWLRRGTMAAAWIALLVFSMKSGIDTAARLISAFYLPLIPLLLIGSGQAVIVRRRWWRILAGGTMVLALIVLVLSPDRPLWPAQTILSKILAKHPGQRAARRALEVYTVYSKRNDALADVRRLLPPDLKILGFVGDTDDCDISLWRPFGSRRVEHILLTDSPEYAQSRAQYVVVGGWALGESGITLDEWLRKNNAELVASASAIEKLTQGKQPWYLTRFRR